MELVVLSRLYERPIVVYQELESTKIQEQIFPAGKEGKKKGCSMDKFTNPVSAPPFAYFLECVWAGGVLVMPVCVHFFIVILLCWNQILLAYLDGNHYDAVYTLDHMNSLSFCQGNSLLSFITLILFPLFFPFSYPFPSSSPLSLYPAPCLPFLNLLFP